MSYLSQPTSNLNYGVVKVGANVQVTDGVISVAQDLDPNSSVTFDSVYVTGNLLFSGDQVVTSVTPAAGAGIALTDVLTDGPAASFKVINTGVLSLAANVGIGLSGSTGNVTVSNTGVYGLVAGPGITISSHTGNVTVSATGADLIHVYGTTTSYTATNEDEYIGVNSVAAVTITLPVGVSGRCYTIKDEHGQGSGKITIQPQPGELIDNGTTYVISVPYQSVTVVFRAGTWWIM